MKILVSYRGAPRIRGWETGAMVAAAFRRLGHDVDEYAKIYQEDKFVSPFGDTDDVVPTAAYKAVIDQEYDLVLNMECNDPDPQYFHLTEVKACKRAVWHFDTSYYMSSLAHIKGYKPDHIFFANCYFRSYLFKNSSWLPYAADPRFMRPLNVDKKIDVGLVGSSRPDRVKLIDFLDKNGINAKLISGVFKEDYIDALASCRIVINENPPQGAGLLNMRSFEAPAAGAVLLSSDEELHEVLWTLTECRVYPNMGIASEMCNNLLSDPVGLIDVAKRGQERIKSDHMYDNRAQEILDVLF